MVRLSAQFIADTYQELHRLASYTLRGRKACFTLSPTALLHEAYLRLHHGKSHDWNDRQHFLAAATRIMRCVLVDYVRQQSAGKRSGPGERVTLQLAAGREDAIGLALPDLLSLDQALRRLAKVDDRKVRVIELRYFGDLELEEIAELLEISPATVKRDWQFARAWLFAELRSGRCLDRGHEPKPAAAD